LPAYVQARRQDLAAGGGKKPEDGVTFLKYSVECMQQPEGQMSNGGPGTTGPPLATALHMYEAYTEKSARNMHVLWMTL